MNKKWTRKRGILIPREERFLEFLDAESHFDVLERFANLDEDAQRLFIELVTGTPLSQIPVDDYTRGILHDAGLLEWIGGCYWIDLPIFYAFNYNGCVLDARVCIK